MNERKRVFFLVFIVAASTLIVAGVAVSMLYRAAFDEERARLIETAQSQARLIEAVARFDARYNKAPLVFSNGMNINGKPYRAIWLNPEDAGCVQIIDQRHLPHELVIEDLRTVSQAARGDQPT